MHFATFARLHLTLAAVLVFSQGCVGSAGTNDAGEPIGGGAAGTGGGSQSGAGGGTVIGGGAVALSSVQVSDAETGHTGKLRVTLTNLSNQDTVVTLGSSAPAIATIGASTTIPRGALSVDVDWQGVAPGSSVLRATLGDSAIDSIVSVVEKFDCARYLSAFSLEPGADQIYSVYCGGRLPDSRTIALTSSDTTVATVPSANGSPYSYTTYFSVHAVAVGTANLLLDAKPVSAIRVVDHARLASAYSTDLALVGVPFDVSVSLDAIVAAKRTVTVAGAGADKTIDVQPGSNSGHSLVTPTAAGPLTLTLTLGDSTLTRTVTVLSSPSLSNLYLDQSPVALNNSSHGQPNLTANLNVAVNAPYDLSLTSSDPTVLQVPSKLTIVSGQAGSVPVTPLKPGVVIITATTSAGVSLTTVVSVVTDAKTENPGFALYASNERLLVGAVGTLNLQGAPGLVSLTSSDPTVIALPSTVPSGYTSISFIAQKSGSVTLTATSGTLSAQVAVQVLSTQVLTVNNSRVDVKPGASESVSFSLAAQPLPGTMVTFESSTPSVAPAPKSLLINSSYQSVSIAGLASGSSMITVHVGSASATFIVYVSDGGTHVPVLAYAYPRSPGLQVGATTPVSYGLNQAVSVDLPVSVTTTTPGIVQVVGAAPNIRAGTSSGTTYLVALAEGTTDVTLKSLGVSQTFTVHVAAKPTFTLSLAATAKVGSTLVGVVQSDVTLAKDVTLTVSSSTPATGTVPTTLIVGLNDGEQNPTSEFPFNALAAGTSTVTVSGSGITPLTQLVTVSP